MSQMIEDAIYFKIVSEDNLVSPRTTDEVLGKPEFLGGCPEKEKLWALTASQATERDRLYPYYVKHLAATGKGPPDIRVFHEVRNYETCKWEISNWGKPTSKLPAGKEASDIETDLAKLKITRSRRGEWGKNEWLCVLAALKRLTKEEIEKIAGVAFQREGVSRKDRDAAGDYNQARHTIFLYDKAMENCDAMALGTNPATMLPASAGHILHEVGHAIAYAKIHLTWSKYQNANDEMKKKGRAMWKKWGDRAFPWDDERGNLKENKKTNSMAVSEDKREQYKKEENDFIKSHEHASTLNGEVPEVSPVVLRFQKLVDTKKLVPVTPYAKKKVHNARKSNRTSEIYRSAMEEFLAESFSIWKWYPKWLENHRPEIFEFFKKERHLKK